MTSSTLDASKAAAASEAREAFATLILVQVETRSEKILRRSTLRRGGADGLLTMTCTNKLYCTHAYYRSDRSRQVGGTFCAVRRLQSRLKLHVGERHRGAVDGKVSVERSGDNRSHGDGELVSRWRRLLPRLHDPERGQMRPPSYLEFPRRP